MFFKLKLKHAHILFAFIVDCWDRPQNIPLSRVLSHQQINAVPVFKYLGIKLNGKS